MKAVPIARFLSAVLLVALLASFGGVMIYHLLPDWPTRGQFGDMFGVVNTFFTALTFAGVVYAVLGQRVDFERHALESERTRREFLIAMRTQLLQARIQTHEHLTGVRQRTDSAAEALERLCIAAHRADRHASTGAPLSDPDARGYLDKELAFVSTHWSTVRSILPPDAPSTFAFQELHNFLDLVKRSDSYSEYYEFRRTHGTFEAILSTLLTAFREASTEHIRHLSKMQRDVEDSLTDTQAISKS